MSEKVTPELSLSGESAFLRDAGMSSFAAPSICAVLFDMDGVLVDSER